MDEVFGRYRLHGLLGAGGMGQVYRAFDTELHREVAIKVLPPQAASDPSFEQRFRREARAAAGLGEPHVVPIYDSGEIDGRLFIAMQLVDGTDIATLLKQHGPMPPEHAVALIEQAAAALDTAHAAGLVHRDVKPANLLVTPRNFLYLIDFGIANAPGETKLTSTGAAIGTLSYMAPERFTTGQCDKRADIYALTCVLHECLTGTTPYPARSLEQQMYAHVHGPSPRPSLIRPGVPAAFDDVVARGMAANPEQRYQTAGQLAAAAHASLHTGTAATSSPAAGIRRPAPLPLYRAPTVPNAYDDAAEFNTSSSTALATTQPAADTRPPGLAEPGRRRGVAALAATICLVVAATAAVVFWVHRRGANPAPSTANSASTAAATAQGARAVADTIDVGKWPSSVAVAPGIHSAYVANFEDDTVSVIDTKTNKVRATIATGKNPWMVAVDVTTHTAYTANRFDSTVSVIDMATNKVTATVPTGKHPYSVAVDPAAHTAYAANYDEGTLSVIDTTTNTVTGAIDVGTFPLGLEVDPTTHAVYATNSRDSTVSVVDSASHMVFATIKTGRQPLGVAVDPSTHSAYVTNSGDNTVAVIDTATNTVATTVDVADGPQNVAIDPSTHSAYVTSTGGNSVSVIDTTTNKVTETLNISGPQGVAVSPTTHTVYVTSASHHTVSVITPAR